MAELGSINTRDVHAGTTPVTDAAGQSALKGALSLAGTVIQEGAEADLRGDLQEDATEALRASESPVAVEGLLPGDTAIIELHNEIKKHLATAAQAKDTNARARAQLAMQQTLQDKMAKYGWMRTELQAEYNKFIGASPELTELGINDASSTGARAQTESFLDDIHDLAYGRGLLDFKMDPGDYQIGTIEFAREYNRQSTLMSDRIALEQEERSLALTDKVNARQASLLSMRQMYSPEGGVSALYNRVREAYSGITNIRQAVTLGDTSPATTLALAEAEQDWNTTGRAQTLELLDDSINLIEQRHTQVWGTRMTDGGITVPSSDPLYEASRRMLTGELSALTTLRELIAADNKDVSDILEGVAILRGHRVLSRTNGLQTIADLSAAAPSLLANADKLGLNVSAASKFANYGRSQGLSAELGQVFQSGSVLHGVATMDNAGLSPDEIIKKQDRSRRQGRSYSGVISDANDPALGTAGSWTFVEQVVAAYKETKDPVIRSPARSLAYVNSMIWAMGNSLDHDTTNSPEDKAAIRTILADPTQYEFIESIEGGRSHPMVAAMAQRVNDYWSQAEGDSRSVWLSEINTLASEQFGPQGMRAAAFMAMDTEEINKGKLIFTVNEDSVYKAFGITRNRGDQLPSDPVADINARASIRSLRAIASTLTEQVTKFIQVDTFNNWVIRPGNVLNYLTSIVQKGGGGPDARSLNSMFKLFDTETALLINRGAG